MDHAELQSMKAELRRMQDKIDELEQENHAAPVSRRNMLRGLGAAAAGAAVGGLAFAHPAAAANGDPILAGDTSNVATGSTYLTADTGFSGSNGVFHVTNDSSHNNSNASTSMLSVWADADAAVDRYIGLYAGATTTSPTTISSIGAKLDGPTPLKLMDNTNSGAPTTTFGHVGEFKVHDGDLYYCVFGDLSGSPRVWRKLAGTATAGSYHPVTPHRVYNSRQVAGPTGGPVHTGTPRDISVANAIRVSNGAVDVADFVPVGATAVHCVVQALGTVKLGYLTVNPGGNHVITSSAINWTTGGQTIDNAITLTLNSTRQLALIVGGPGASADVVIDVLGYYL
ncbi:MAG: hypothetical protein WCI22_03235 [Actinomycetota bacterium]